ncbi:unnamed protein product, partial [Thlaspi arvense]
FSLWKKKNKKNKRGKMKFSKQFEGQLLKKDLKKIHLLHNSISPPNQKQKSFPTRLISSLRNFSPFEQPHREHGIIQVHNKLDSSASLGDSYETELLEKFDDSDAAHEFFACLDLQLNKVNQFYRTKEKEFLERGESLKKQMEILLELKTAIKQKQGKGSSKEDDSISGTISCDEESTREKTEQEQGKEKEEFTESENTDEMESSASMRRDDRKMRSLSGRVISCNGKNLRINIPLTNPTRTFSAITYLLWDDLVNQSSRKSGPDGSRLHINKAKLHHAEKMIRGAFIELYKGLGYLKTYRNLNMLAFVKILKKFDKVTNKEVLPIYLKVVENSYFNSSDKGIKLADEVEEIFVKHFAEDNKRKAMKYLKPTQRKESHGVTFFIGLFTGCFLALFSGYIIMAHIGGMYRSKPDTVYMETVYPVLRQTRINYSFIFELAPTKELKYRDVFLICTTSMTAVMGVVFLCPSSGDSGFLLLVFLLFLVCPFNIFYKSSRYRFLCVIRNIILSPLYKVVMLDFFMADQLCSQVPMLRNLENIACYYITGSYKTQDYGYCMRPKYYGDLAYAVSFLPYYWRAMQCARRWFDEGQTSHLVNLGKYVSAMLAAGAKVAYERERTVGWLCLLVAMSSAATVYQLYWDFVKDWGLLQVHSKNPWLRNELMLRRKFIYYFSMMASQFFTEDPFQQAPVLNLVLRLAWLQTVLHYSFSRVDYRVTGLFWQPLKLENEHLNNAGKFRAVKTVPIPFHEVDEED